MRLLPIQYLRAGDVIDIEGSYSQVTEVHRVQILQEPWWDVNFADGSGAYLPDDRMVEVVGHELEVWDDDKDLEPVLLQQEWSLARKAYVAEHEYFGQAD